ncbi:MAG TPA: single-stranded DNA-binding protein [Terriglobales bacterium]
MQKTLLIGYLGKDPEMKYTPGGTAIATFTIASTERWKNSASEPQEHTEWFNIKVFGKRAEVVAERLHKGSRIFLEGRQRTESWDDKQSGGKKYMTFVYADKIEFLGEAQRDGQKGELTRDQSCSQEDPTMITDSDVPF